MDEGGTYYPTAGSISRLANINKLTTNIRYTTESTGGSAYNIENITNGNLDFGLAQSDIAHYAYMGIKKFEGNPHKNLRSVMAIYPELLTLVVRSDSGINTLKEIVGKSLNIGTKNSGTRKTTEIFLKAEGIDTNSIKVGDGTNSQLKLRDNQIKGFFGVYGHPTKNISGVTSSTDIKIISIQGKNIDDFILTHPYYTKGEIPASIYKNVDYPTPTVGVKAVLITDANQSEKVVATLLKAVLDNFDEFKTFHPAYKNITKKSLLEGLAVPLHDSAKKHFQEIGLIE